MTPSAQTPMVFGPLKTRNTPKQARAVQRIHIILTATADLLSGHPVQTITTTQIATHAGIPVSSIYRYFSDVEHVLRELYLQSAQELRDKVLETLENTETRPGWRDRLHHIILTQRDYVRNNPYYRLLLMYFVSARPAVAARDREREYTTELMEMRWKRGQDGFHGGDPKVVAQTVLQIAVAMEDMIAAQSNPENADIYAQEFLTLLDSYLANYLED